MLSQQNEKPIAYMAQFQIYVVSTITTKILKYLS